MRRGMMLTAQTARELAGILDQWERRCENVDGVRRDVVAMWIPRWFARVMIAGVYAIIAVNVMTWMGGDVRPGLVVWLAAWMILFALMQWRQFP